MGWEEFEKLHHSSLNYWDILWDLHNHIVQFKTLGSHLMLVLDAYWDFVQDMLTGFVKRARAAQSIPMIDNPVKVDEV